MALRHSGTLESGQSEPLSPGGRVGRKGGRKGGREGGSGGVYRREGGGEQRKTCKKRERQVERDNYMY